MRVLEKYEEMLIKEKIILQIIISFIFFLFNNIKFLTFFQARRDLNP